MNDFFSFVNKICMHHFTVRKSNSQCATQATSTAARNGYQNAKQGRRCKTVCQKFIAYTLFLVK